MHPHRARLPGIAVAPAAALLTLFGRFRKSTVRSAAPALAVAAKMRVRDVEIELCEGMYPPEGDDYLIVLHKDLRFLTALVDVIDQVRPRRIVEIGLLQGGSTIFWAERYAPERLVAIDLRPEIPQLSHYIERHGLADRVRTHLGIAQDDREPLRRAVQDDLAGAMADAIIDDASHLLAPTRSAAETLLPFLREGGVYVIEDWAWGHHHAWPREWWTDQPLMSSLIVELMLVCGSGTGVLSRVDIDPNFVVLRRGGKALPTDGSFRLEEHYERRGLP